MRLGSEVVELKLDTAEKQYKLLVESINDEIEPVDIESMLKRFDDAGIAYSEAFRTVKSLQCKHEGVSVLAIAKLAVQDCVLSGDDGRGYLVHPTMLEGIVQAASTAACMFSEPGSSKILMSNLVSVDTVCAKLSSQLSTDKYPKELTAYLQLWKISGCVKADSFLADPDEALVFAWRGLKLEHHS